MRHFALTLTIVALGLVLVGCGGSGNGGAGPETVTVVETEATTVTEPSTTEESQSESAGKIKVPDVVGIDHQLAQDTMQEAGLYNLAEEDATGQGRMLLYDRNWTVVSQDPPAGTLVNEDQTITLRSKKDDE